MITRCLNKIKEDNLTLLATILFISLTVWWLQLSITNYENASTNLLFGALYGTSMTLLGGIGGVVGAKYWGGWKSLMGKAIIVLSLGLLSQCFGQIAFSYYNIILKVNTPFPSIADLGYFVFGVPLYIYGITLIAKAAGIKLNLKSWKSLLLVTSIPLCLLGLSYFMFMQHYTFDTSDLLALILNYGYPLGQAVFLSLAILTYSLSKKSLGGLMRPKIMLVLLAYFFQYLADSNFLWQSLNATWINGAYGDFLYLIAYFFMTMSIFQLNATVKQIKNLK